MASTVRHLATVLGAVTRREFRSFLTTYPLFFLHLFQPLLLLLLLSYYIFKCFWHQPAKRKGWDLVLFLVFLLGSQKANRKYRSISLRNNLPFCFVSFTTCCRLSLTTLFFFFFSSSSSSSPSLTIFVEDCIWLLRHCFG